MVNFDVFQKKINKSENEFLIKVCALLIHAAKIDENFTENEEKIIKKTLFELGSLKEELPVIIKKGKIRGKFKSNFRFY